LIAIFGETEQTFVEGGVDKLSFRRHELTCPRACDQPISPPESACDAFLPIR
jgi:hypothetical protein